MEISISTFKGREPWRYKRFKTAMCLSIAGLGPLILKNVWSPIVWRDGKRTTDNFIKSSLAVFDFDDGEWSLENAFEYLVKNKLCGVIAPTKSHNKDKNGLVCDRFRMIIPWTSVITDYPTYRQNLERLYRKVPCDSQCKDGARMYQPSTEIAVMQLDGRSLDWKPFKEDKKYNLTNYHSTVGVLPKFVDDMLKQQPPAGQRNKHCFRIAAKMAEMGFEEIEVINAVLGCAVDLPPREKEMTARSGFRAGRKNRFF